MSSTVDMNKIRKALENAEHSPDCDLSSIVREGAVCTCGLDDGLAEFDKAQEAEFLSGESADGEFLVWHKSDPDNAVAAVFHGPFRDRFLERIEVHSPHTRPNKALTDEELHRCYLERRASLMGSGLTADEAHRAASEYKAGMMQARLRYLSPARITKTLHEDLDSWARVHGHVMEVANEVASGDVFGVWVEKDGKIVLKSETWHCGERDEDYHTFDPSLLRVEDRLERARLIAEAKLAARTEIERARDERIAEANRLKEAKRKKRSEAAKKGRKTLYEKLKREFDQNEPT